MTSAATVLEEVPHGDLTARRELDQLAIPVQEEAAAARRKLLAQEQSLDLQLALSETEGFPAGGLTETP